MGDTAQEGRLFVLVGTSGAGKNALLAEIVRQSNIRRLVSVTTRPPRPGERDGRDYHFVSTVTFDALRAQHLLFEAEQFAGEWYGTLIDDLGQYDGVDRICIRENAGARTMKELGAAIVAVMPPSAEIAVERMRARGDDEQRIAARRAADEAREREIYEIADVVIVNDELAQTVGAFRLFAERHTVARAARRHSCDAMSAPPVSTFDQWPPSLQ